MFFASNISSKAQEYIIVPCSDWLELEEGETDWIGGVDPGWGSFFLYECGGCKYAIEFWYRVKRVSPTMLTYETQITRIFKYGGGACTGCPDEEIQRIVNKSLFEWLQNNDPEEILEEYQRLDNIYSTVRHTCESKIFFNEPEIVMLDPDIIINFDEETSPPIDISTGYIHLPVHWVIRFCVGVQCCKMKYNTTWLYPGSGFSTINTITYDTDFPGYTTQYPPCPNPQNCTNKCNDLKWNWSISEGFNYDPSPKLIFNIDEEVLTDISISPNPNNSAFNFNFSNSFEGEITIKVVNTLGEIIYEVKEQKNSSYFNKNIELLNLTNGQYNLIISFEEKFISKKFIIIK